MSGIEGVRVWRDTVNNRWIEFGDSHMDAPYIAHAAPVAAALVAVAEAAHTYALSSAPEDYEILCAALDALTEAQTGAS